MEQWPVGLRDQILGILRMKKSPRFLGLILALWKDQAKVIMRFISSLTLAYRREIEFPSVLKV